MIWNPWKKIRQLEQKVDFWEDETFTACGQIEDLVTALERVALEARPSSSAVAKKMASIAQAALDKFRFDEVIVQ